MAGGGQKKEAKRQSERVAPRLAPGSSRVSQAAGGQDSGKVQSIHVEQRSNVPAPKASARNAASSKSSSRGKQAGSKTKKSSPPVSPAPVAMAAPNPSTDPRDTQFIKWASDKWRALEPHHQQRLFGAILLFLSLLLFSSLTIFQSSPLLSGINHFFLLFFGWSAYLLALGLVAFALVHLIEGMRNERFLRWSLVIGLLCIWLLLLIESRLILGPKVGILAEWLVTLLLGWPLAVGHVVVLGLLIVVATFTFRIRFGHILMLGQAIQRLLADAPSPANGNAAPSPYLGQRPQYSRYSASKSASIPDRQSAAGQLARTARRPIEDDADLEEEDDEGDIDFEPDFESDDDPLNDINIHKQQVGLVPRGPRSAPPPLDPNEHASAVHGASQQALPFNQDAKVQNTNVKKVNAMEPLAPNPSLLSKLQGKGRSRAANAEPNISSPWKLPTTELLNSPDETKLHMLGDDTTTMAKIIQDTLRSFRVEAEVRPEDISIGPTVIRFGIRPTGKPEMKLDEKTGKMVPVRDASGQIVYETRTRVSRIMALQNDLALVLEAKTIRMEAPVPGRPYVGVEIPNKNSRLVTLREVLESKEYLAAKAKSKLAIALGKDVAGLVRVGDLARKPHLLIAGATGAGKSVMINAIIASIITQATPDDVRMLMVDPKMVELNMYNGIPHLLSPVVIEVDKVVSLLKNAINEMERRYRLFS